VAGGPVDGAIGGIGFVAAHRGSELHSPARSIVRCRIGPSSTLAKVDEAAKGSFGVGADVVQEDAASARGLAGARL